MPEHGVSRPPVSSSAPTGAQPVAAQSPLRKAPAKPGSGGVEPEQMQFEPVQRGHFQETSQTVIDGQDLDVPTFLRRRSGQK
jgi:cell division protein FtsZ